LSQVSVKQILKSMILDIIVMVALFITVIFQIPWLEVLLLGYTSLMLIVRVIVYFNETILRNMYRRMDELPSWPINFIYAIDVLIASAGGLFLIAAMWGAIWLLAFLSEKKGRKFSGGK